MPEVKRPRKRGRGDSRSASSSDRGRDRSRSRSPEKESSSRHRHSSDKHKHKKKRRKHKDKDRRTGSDGSRSNSRGRSPKRSKQKHKDRESSKEKRNRYRSRSNNSKKYPSQSYDSSLHHSRESSHRKNRDNDDNYKNSMETKNEHPRQRQDRRRSIEPRGRSIENRKRSSERDHRHHQVLEEKYTANDPIEQTTQKKTVELSNFRISSVRNPRKIANSVVNVASFGMDQPDGDATKKTCFPDEAANQDGIGDQEKRKQRLKLWQEKLKSQSTCLENQLFFPEVEQKEENSTINNKDSQDKNEVQSTEEMSVSVTKNEKEETPIEEEEEEEEVEEDPLDAFMSTLEAQATSQEVFGGGSRSTFSKQKQPTSYPISISFEEIQQLNKKMEANAYGSFIPPSSVSDIDDVDSEDMYPDPGNADFSYGGITPQRVEESDEQRELREKQEHQEFMEAIRKEREREASLTIFKDEELSKGVTEVDNTVVKEDLGLGRIYQGTDEDMIGEESGQTDTRSALEILQESQKKKDIRAVDHSKMEYASFQKKFYIEPKEIKKMTDEEVEDIRSKLEIKIRGKGCQKPIETWSQCGFSSRLLRVIEKQKYEVPFAIQRQALPVIMSGRDVIGIAKTGSGKTLAFLLPMFRHISHQPPLLDGEGPIGLVMAPARELALQIYNEAKKFTKDLGLHVTAIYGGAGVAEQIANLKRGSDIVVCTPGRMIDILCMNAGKLISLKRITYVVLDEADRMFDMGFEPQITKILTNIRPDRQTLLFSATFPRQVESLARKALTRPIEITVGSRNTASGDIKQYVEVREDKDKFMRLLQLLGIWYEKGNVLVFVNTQQACDQLFQDLMKAGYPALSLHGGKEQMDRDYTIDDFKRKIRTLMVATSVAGRGLDVKDLVLVINYHCPNHIEDYVHRVGRTGRAGNKGTAYTFISPEEEAYSLDLVKALESGKQDIPPELIAMGESFKKKVSEGEAKYHGSGFKGKGFTFDEDEKTEAQIAADMQKRQYEIEQGIIDPTEYRVVGDELEAVEEGFEENVNDGSSNTMDTNVAVAQAAERAKALAREITTGKTPSNSMAAVKKAHQIAQILDLQYRKKQIDQAEASGVGHFEEEIEINDYPQQARWKVTQKEASESITELTGAAIIARGSFVPSGRKPNPGERKLYLAIEGPTLLSVIDAKREIQRVLDETTLQVGLGGEKYSKYTI